MVKSIVGWILATASIIIGLLVFLGAVLLVSDLLGGPGGPGAAAIGTMFAGIGRGIGWLFGTALPGLGDAIIDGVRTRLGGGGGGGASGGSPSVTTITVIIR